MAQNQFIEARVQGHFRRAADAEHTGYEVSAGTITWEVDVTSDPQLSQRAAQLDRQVVIVTGTYTERPGVSRTRRILSAKTLAPAPDEDETQRGFEVTVRGVVRTGMVAIGGETTGATITSGPVTWELELDDQQQELAGRLSGKPAIVTGRLTEVRGVEIRRRFIVRVAKIDAG